MVMAMVTAMATMMRMKIANRHIDIRLIRHFLIYLGSNGLSKAMPFMVLPLIANSLDTADFGLISNFTVGAQFFGAFISMRLVASLQANYYNQNQLERKEMISNLIYLMTFVTIVISLLCLSLSRTITALTMLSFKWILLALFVALGTSIFQLRTALLRLEENPKEFAFYEFGNSFLSAFLSLLLVVVLNYSWQGRVTASVLTVSIMLGFTLFFFVKGKWFPTRINIERIREYFFFGFPLIPHALTPFLRMGVDKIIITSFLGLAINGVFSLAATLGAVFTMLASSFFAVYTPYIYKTLSSFTGGNEEDQAQKERIVRQGYLALLLFSLVLFLGYWILYFLFHFFFDERYASALTYLPWFCIDVFFLALFQLLSAYVLYSKKTKSLGAAAFFSGLLQVAISIILVPLIGVNGALIAMLFSGVTRFVLTLFLANKHYPMPWKQVGCQLIRGKFLLE